MSAVKDYMTKLRDYADPEKYPGWSQTPPDVQAELKFQFDAMMSMCEVFMEKQMKHEPFIKRCKEDFAKMDKNGDGVVSMEEFGTTMREYMAAALPPDAFSEEDKQKLIDYNIKGFFGVVDLNKDGCVSLDEYMLSQAFSSFNATMSPTVIEEVVYIQEPPEKKRASVALVAPDAEYGKPEKKEPQTKKKAVGCC
jgi:hypothetical protein